MQAGEQPLTSTGQRLPPLQVEADMAPGLLLTDISFAQPLLNMPGRLSRLLVDNTFAARHPTPPAALQLKQGEDNNLSRLTESFHLNLDAVGFLSFVVGLFIVHAAIGLALEQRRGLLRTLRACGVSARMLILSLGIELGCLALLSGVLGIASGYLLASLLLPDVAASLRGLYGAEVAGQLNLSPWWWLAGLGVSLLGALLAGASSLWRAARLPLLALANAQAWHQAHGRWLRRQGWVASAALVIAVLALWLGDSLAAGFVLMAALLLGAALALPVLLNGFLKAVLGRSRSVLGQWFLADCRQQLPALSLALMALLLALAANIGAGSMTSGFRQTFTHWLEQRLTAELYLNPQNPQQAEQLKAWLTRQPLVQAVLPAWQVSVQLQGWPAEVFGVVDNPTLSSTLAAAGGGGRALGSLAARRQPHAQRTTGATPEGATGRYGFHPHPAGHLGAEDRRHLRRLRQPQGPSAGQCPALAGALADALTGTLQPAGGPRRRAAADP